MTWTVGQVLRDRNAGLYLVGAVVSGFGSSAMWLTAGVWVKELTGSDSLAALCTFALWAPTLVGPLLGALADRARRRPLLVGTNLGLGALLLPLLTVDSPDRLWLLFAVLVVYGAAGVVHDAAEAALVAAAVDRDLLGDFNGLRTTANEGVKLVAPLAGAGLFAVYGGPAVALLDAVTFALAAGLYALLRVRETRPARPTTGWWAQTAEGARYLCRHARLRPLVVAGGVTMLLAGFNGAAIFAVADEGLGHSPAYVGLLYAVQGVGSVIIGLASGALMRRLGERRFAAAGIALFAAAVALRALPYDAVALASSAAIGLGLPCVLIAALTAVQRETPDTLLGRATATANTLVFTPNAVGLALGAGLIAILDHLVLLPVLGTAGAVTATVLLRRGD
ncbi:MFS transporter [Streptomyces sp. PSKA54]|uniref:MFS transporter n=1 Tax=Streptomyces himalayensis subsp. aureolus TaxID=2758039 RepID=A0A7W2CVM0_9ACTN|nr:MFS transporter [Streptomyces himalayensis]MBA4859898.1 MFS transporter [Streptomyces himalayensis subsp. aureolus]